MKVINNGNGLEIHASYLEASRITETLKKGATQYDQEDLPVFAEAARELVNELLNEQIIKVGEKE